MVTTEGKSRRHVGSSRPVRVPQHMYPPADLSRRAANHPAIFDMTQAIMGECAARAYKGKMPEAGKVIEFVRPLAGPS